MIVLSLAIAAAGFVQPTLFPWPHYHLVFTIATMFVLALLWIIVLLAGLIIHGKRGLWLRIGAPLALFWSAMLGSLYLMCHLAMDCM
jgi:hypothetical protein